MPRSDGVILLLAASAIDLPQGARQTQTDVVRAKPHFPFYALFVFAYASPLQGYLAGGIIQAKSQKSKHNGGKHLMTRDEALALVREYVKNENLVKHMLAVEAAMRFYAEKLGEDVDLWGLTGLLHDFDWEIHPTAEQHPRDGAPILRERGVDEVIVRAILSHGDHAEVPRQTRMEKALFACDEVTGLITAVALVRPSRSLLDLEAASVKKKWKDKAFAAGANREEIERSAREFGVDLWEHVGNVIQAMRRIAPQLGLTGNLS